MDGIDAVLVDISNREFSAVAASSLPYPSKLLADLHTLCDRSPDEINRMGETDREVGKHFAKVINQLLTKQQLSSADICAIGSHGQTIRHYPNGYGKSDKTAGFTLQIGDPATIAVDTGIDVIADFRRKDIALGGQGAPLVPAFHAAQFSNPEQSRVIVNIGGFANITLLRGTDKSQVSGFDTGPGNVLMDAWCLKHTHQPYDDAGHWAAQGNANNALLQDMLNAPYFTEFGPKSTGREYFNLAWVEGHLRNHTHIEAVDVQATLLVLTVQTIVDAITTLGDIDQCFVCGGGAYNTALMQQLSEQLNTIQTQTTDQLELPPQWVEGAAFAWLAWAYQQGKAGNVPAVTGARREAILGTLTTAR